MQWYRRQIERLLEGTDVRLDGPRQWDLQVHDPRFYRRVLSHGSLGLGEAYMDGWWGCAQLDEMFYRLFAARLDERMAGLPYFFDSLRASLLNLQSGWRAFVIGKRHYDLGDDLYRRMLGKYMIYSCGYWKRADNLDQAQEAKLDLVCRKLCLQSGMRVLDIGCGWGEAAKFAAERYGVEVVGITVSRNQYEHARELCRGLPVDIRLQDYRDVQDSFDAIFSIGMFEHVGHKNYRRYMETVRRCLKPDGLSLLHTIGSNKSVHTTDPWIARYIFPNSMLPSARQITAAAEGLFTLEDWHNFGPGYDKTLLAWHRNFEQHWEELKQTRDERFHRMWRYFLLVSAASFRARKNQLWQIIFSPIDSRREYERLT